MTMAALGTYTRMMKSAGARALEDQLAAFATQWVMKVCLHRHTRTERLNFAYDSRATVPTKLAVFHELRSSALACAADSWNQRYHAMRKLPLEIFELCWSFLETPDLIGVAAACKLWRQLVHDARALWTNVTFRGSPYHNELLGPVLERSRDSLFDLSVTIYGPSGAEELVKVLRSHAHRLRRLELHPHRAYYDGRVLMQFHAPALREFVSHVQHLSFREGSFIFSCPNLKRMQVVWLSLNPPSQLSPIRLCSVTSLKFLWTGRSLNGLYDAFPALASLDIRRCERTRYTFGPPPSFDLPRDKPPPATLQRVVLRGVGLSYDDLRALGFTSVRDLEIEGDGDCIFKSLNETFALFGALGGTPRSASLQGKRLVVRADGPGLRNLCMTFDVDTTEPVHQYYTVVAHPAVRANIRSLALSVDEQPLPLDEFRPHFLFPADEFPALETLVLPVGHPLLNLDFMKEGGTLRAPALRRLAIVDTPRGRCDGEARSLKPLFLAVFIARHIELAPGRKLEELVLDGDHGVVLCDREDPYDDGLDILHSYVGTITHRYWPQGVY